MAKNTQETSTSNRFDLDLSEIPDTAPIIPVAIYPGKITKATFMSGVSEKTGKYWGMLSLVVAINDPEIAKLMGQNEPKVFGSVMMNFEEDTGLLSKTNNPGLKNLLSAAELLGKMEFFKEGTEGLDDPADYYKAYFGNIANVLVGYDLMFKIGQRANNQDKAKKENFIVSFAAV